MIATAILMLSFKIPEDYDEEQVFLATHKGEEWIKEVSSNWVTYKKVRTTITEDCNGSNY